MPEGIQVIGSHGIVQIDSEYRNLAFLSKHTLTTNLALNVDSSQVSLALTGRTTPVVAIRSTMPVIVISVFKPNATDWTFTFIAKGAIGTQFDVYVFDVPPAPPTNGSGLQVFTSTGLCAFDSSRKGMVVVDAWTVPGGGSGGYMDHNATYAWRTIPAGRQWGIVHSATAMLALSTDPGGMGAVPVFVRGAGFKYSGQDLSLEVFIAFTYNAAPDTNSGGTTGQYLAVDVTNL